MKEYLLSYLIILLTLLLGKPVYKLGKMIGERIKKSICSRRRGIINENS